MNDDKENTFRALKDEPLIAQHQFRCWIGLHKWTIWETIKTSYNGNSYPESTTFTQTRNCIWCNKIFGRKIELKGDYRKSYGQS